jgi:hypothetical protein
MNDLFMAAPFPFEYNFEIGIPAKSLRDIFWADVSVCRELPDHTCGSQRFTVS